VYLAGAGASGIISYRGKKAVCSIPDNAVGKEKKKTKRPPIWSGQPNSYRRETASNTAD
jgi:hypothetical protein